MAFHYLATVFGKVVILSITVVAADWPRTVEKLLEVMILFWFDNHCVLTFVLYVHNCVVFQLLIGGLNVHMV